MMLGDANLILTDAERSRKKENLFLFCFNA